MPFTAIEAANSCVSRSKKLLAASDDAANIEVRDDLIRSALVMAISAMDSYMHWMVFQEITAVSKNAKLPKALSKLEIPFSDVAALADAVIEGRREGKETRPWNALKNSAQRQLLFRTFQSFDQVSVAMSMAGIADGWTKTSKALGVTSPEIKEKLNHLVHRRNQIAHEGDILRSSRPRQLKFNDLDSGQVSRDVDWIASVIAAIESIR
ncbi:HEPN domain-containing protein [Pseudomonas sp. W2-17]|uniref:HEPN domain-containing protein n=1 Tax=Pseudomonas sp. W2-17 TaxID=3058039 RepID=UPI0034E06F4D